MVEVKIKTLLLYGFNELLPVFHSVRVRINEEDLVVSNNEAKKFL